MSPTAEAAPRAAAQGRVDLPDRSLFWKWVWSAIRPVLGWALAVAGTVALVVGWFGVSGESLTAKQLPYLVSGGLSGIALFIMAGVFLATDDVRRQLARIGELERKVDDLYALFATELAAPTSPRPSAAPAPSTTPASSPADVLALPAGTSYHRPGCALVAGKTEAAAVTAADIDRRRLRPCRVCDPDAVASG